MIANGSLGRSMLAATMLAAISMLNPDSTVLAQQVQITTPSNDSDQPSNTSVTVSGTWTDNSLVSSRKVLVDLHEVDSSNEPISENSLWDGSDEVSNIDTSGSWSVSATMPAVPSGQSRKYRIRARLIMDDDEDDPLDTSTIYIRITVSGGPGGGGS